MLPLSIPDISTWIAVMAILLFVTSELIPPHSEHFGYLAIDKKRLRFVALILGASFVVTVWLIATAAL